MLHIGTIPAVVTNHKCFKAFTLNIIFVLIFMSQLPGAQSSSEDASLSNTLFFPFKTHHNVSSSVAGSYTETMKTNGRTPMELSEESPLSGQSSGGILISSPVFKIQVFQCKILLLFQLARCHLHKPAVVLTTHFVLNISG